MNFASWATVQKELQVGETMYKGTEVCFGTSEKFQGAGAPGEITESTEQRPTSYTNELIYTTETDSQT